MNSLATLGAQKSRGLSLQVVALQHEWPEGKATTCVQHARVAMAGWGKHIATAGFNASKDRAGFGGLKH